MWTCGVLMVMSCVLPLDILIRQSSLLIIVNKRKLVFYKVATGKVKVNIELSKMQISATIFAVKMSVHYRINITCNKLFGKT